MKSYTTLRNLYGSLTMDTSTSNLTLGDQVINDSIRTIANIRGGKWKWLEEVFTIATVTSGTHEIPNRVRKIMDLYVTVGSTTYMPIPIEDPVKWKQILASNLGSSDIPLFYYKQNDQLLLQPKPTVTTNTITFRARLKIRDLNIADYTTGTITSLANAGTAIVASGTTFTADMIGRFIRITETTAAGGGDGYWYEIGSFTDATNIAISKPYQGTTLAAATAAYTIGQMSLLPEAYDVAPVYRAVALYWDKEGDLNRSARYWRLYDGGQEAGLSNLIGGLIGQMLEEEESVEGAYIPPLNANLWVDPNNPPYNLTGF